MDNVINIINTAVCTGLPGGSDVKNLPADAWDTGGTGSIPESGRSPGGGDGTPLQYSWLEDPIDRGAWRVTVHGIAKSWTWLSTHACMLYMKIEKILSSHLKEKNYFYFFNFVPIRDDEYVWNLWWKALHNICKSYDYVVHLKFIVLCVNYISTKLESKK